MKKYIKKLFTTVVLIVVLLNTVLLNKYGKVKAKELEEVNMNCTKRISNVLKYDGINIENQYISYTNDNIEYPIYKLQLEEQEISNTNCKLQSNNENNNIIWRVIKYGYPYATLEEMGVSNEDEAYCVTQEAIYCLLNLKDISKYSSENEKNRLALINLINKAKESTEEYNNSDISIEEFGGFYKENINNKVHYIQKFKLHSNNPIYGYNVEIEGAPQDAKIVDLSNNEQNAFNDQYFKVIMLHKNITEELKFKVYAKNILINTFQIKFGSINEKNYCITLNKEESVNDCEYEFSKETNLSTIRAKVIFKNGITKPNAKIELTKQGEFIAEGYTDENGIISFSGLYPGMYSVYERDINGDILGDMPLTLSLQYSEQVNINVVNDVSSEANIIVENEKKKGTIEVHISDLDNDNIDISNAELEIYDTKDTFIEKLVTDENGLAVSSRLPIDKEYILVQKSTMKDYNLPKEKYNIKFKENDEIIMKDIKNEFKKNCIKITKVDKDDNNIKLEGVKFGIYDSNNELIEEIVTNKDGQATSSNLPINKSYYVREIQTLDNYILDNKTITVFLKEDDSKIDKSINNQKEIKIDRLSSFNNFLVLENQKLYDILPKFGC